MTVTTHGPALAVVNVASNKKTASMAVHCIRLIVHAFMVAVSRTGLFVIGLVASWKHVTESKTIACTVVCWMRKSACASSVNGHGVVILVCVIRACALKMTAATVHLLTRSNASVSSAHTHGKVNYATPAA